MSLRFDREAALWAALIFMVEVLIATVWSHHRWLRGFVGDVLAVVWVYFLLKTVVKANTTGLALAAFAVGCLVELAQYVAAVNGWHVENRVVRIVLGSVADWMDVLAYGCGFLMVLGLESLLARLAPSPLRGEGRGEDPAAAGCHLAKSCSKTQRSGPG